MDWSGVEGLMKIRLMSLGIYDNSIFYFFFSYFFLPELNSEFESVEVHPFSVLESWSGWVMIEQDLQLVGAPRVVQKGRGEVLALLPQLLQVKLKINNNQYNINLSLPVRTRTRTSQLLALM